MPRIEARPRAAAPGVLARALRIALGLELLAYLLLGSWLLANRHWPLWQDLLLVLALALGARALITAHLFAVAELFRAPRPQAVRLGAWAALRLFAGELLALTYVYLVSQPFERRQGRPPALAPARSAAQPPVLLLHGFLCNQAIWGPLRRQLARQGYADVHACSFEPVFGDIEDFAQQLARSIEDLCACSGAAQVVLVGHSMGGLAARAYLRAHGARRVRKLITIGSPHQGTVHARSIAFAGRNLRQMRVDSAWLAQLQELPPAVPTTCIYSHHDNIVAPQDGARLDGARNIAVAGIGHLEMAVSPVIGALVLRELRD